MNGTKSSHNIFKVISGIYLITLFVLLFVAHRRINNVDYSRYNNTTPLVKLFNFNWANKKYWWLYYLEILSNLFVFVPFPVAVAVLFNKLSKFKIFIVVLITPVIVELLQLILRVGVFDIDDIILNAAGGVAGIIIYYNFIRKMCLPAD